MALYTIPTFRPDREDWVADPSPWVPVGGGTYQVEVTKSVPYTSNTFRSGVTSLHDVSFPIETNDDVPVCFADFTLSEFVSTPGFLGNVATLNMSNSVDLLPRTGPDDDAMYFRARNRFQGGHTLLYTGVDLPFTLDNWPQLVQGQDVIEFVDSWLNVDMSQSEPGWTLMYDHRMSLVVDGTEAFAAVAGDVVATPQHLAMKTIAEDTTIDALMPPGCATVSLHYEAGTPGVQAALPRGFSWGVQAEWFVKARITRTVFTPRVEPVILDVDAEVKARKKSKITPSFPPERTHQARRRRDNTR